MEKADVIIIGAGVAGLAAGRALAMSGRHVVVADSEAFAGSGTSSRNSGVIHAGIYYPKGSAKARFCVEGKQLLYNYIREHAIPYQNCSKLIVATKPEELEKLEAIRKKASDNGVIDLKIISEGEAKSMEPELACVGALVSPSTGIIDVHEYLHALMADIESYGGTIALQNTIDGGRVTDEGIILTINGEDVIAKTVINAGGIGAQSIAGKIEGVPASSIPTQYLAKGNYFTVSGDRPFSRLVYPVPVVGGLGAHFTMNMAGESLFGPDVEWIDPQDYKSLDYTVDPERGEKFYGYIEKYYPGIRGRELRPAYAGVRPKLSASGSPDGDFLIQGPKDHSVKGLVNLYGIESPGLTSSLAIADHVKTLLEDAA